eukprot:363692-Chlamydomonas_euryale.AAC.11
MAPPTSAGQGGQRRRCIVVRHVTGRSDDWTWPGSPSDGHATPQGSPRRRALPHVHTTAVSLPSDPSPPLALATPTFCLS